MVIYIEKAKAIDLIKKCQRDLNSNDFSPKAWKVETAYHLEMIFGDHLKTGEINGLPFRSRYDTVNSRAEMIAYKATAKQLLQSYINIITTHVPEPLTEEEQTMQQKIFELKMDVARMQESNMTYDRENRRLNAVNENHVNALNLHVKTIENLEKKNFELKQNTVQLDDLTIDKLWFLIRQLPLPQFWALVLIVASLIAGIYFLSKITVLPG